MTHGQARCRKSSIEGACVLSQNLDENNNIQTSTDRCTTSSTVNSSVWYCCVCVCYIEFAGETSVYVVQ